MVYSFQAPAVIARDVLRLNPGLVVAAEQDFGAELREAMCGQGAAAISLGGMDAALLPGFERSSARPDPDAPAVPTIEIQTSGTTGPPKRFPVPYEKAYQNFFVRLTGEKPGDASSPPALVFMSFANLSGMMGLLPFLLRRQRMILYEKFDLDAWREHTRTYRPERSGLQPAAMQMLLDANAPPEELSSIKSMIVGSAPLDYLVRREFEARYGIPVILAYGATEFYGTVASMTPELLATWGDEKFGSVGPPVQGAEIRTVDQETGAPCPVGETGVLEVRADWIGPDWIHTSDLGMIDKDGFLYLKGRADGAIIRGGFKLLPETIELGLTSHDAVAVASVVGVPDRRLGQVPAAAIQLNPSAPPIARDELEAHLRQEVPATHIPVHWRFVDRLPRTVSMKIDRGAVARLFTQDEVA